MITGGAGFIGSHLAEFFLLKKYQVIIVTRKDSKNLKSIRKKVKIEKFDVTNHEKIKKSILKNKPDIIIHLAGNTSHSKSFEFPIKDLESNAKSTLEILEILRRFHPKCKFILGSTFVVVGKPRKLPVNEKTVCNPSTIYGADKLVSENYARIYNSVYGLHTNIFRITNSFGPREKTIANKNALNFLIYNAFKGNEVTIFNKGKIFRDIIYIDDVTSGIFTICKKGKPGEVYWISSGRKTWFSDIAGILKNETGCKILYVKTPTYTKKVDVGNFVVDNSKLKKLGWKPKISVNVGISKTIDYFKKSHF